MKLTLPEHVSAVSPLGEAIDGSRRIVRRRAVRQSPDGYTCPHCEGPLDPPVITGLLRDAQQNKHRRERSNQRLREKRITDPVWRERRNKRDREYVARVRQGKPCECGCGGMTAQGRFLPGHNKLQDGRLSPCGTHAAYVRHKRRGEEACEPCKDAHAATTRQARRAA